MCCFTEFMDKQLESYNEAAAYTTGIGHHGASHETEVW